MVLVKLRQMPPKRTEAIRLDTRDPGLWRDFGQGRHEAELFEAPCERVVMLRPAPCALRLAPGHAGSRLTLANQDGVLLYRETGHLG